MKEFGIQPGSIIDDMMQRTLHGKEDSDAHVMALLGLTLQLQPTLTLELGVRSGTTTLPFLMGSHLSGGTVISVDLNETEFEPPEFLEESWTFVQMDALEFLEQWGELNPDVKFDLVYIDDWHAADHVAREIELLENYIRPESILLFHDAMSGTWRGPWNLNQVKVREGWGDHYMPEWYYSDTGEFAGGGPSTAIRNLDLDVWEYCTIPIYHGLTLVRKKVKLEE